MKNWVAKKKIKKKQNVKPIKNSKHSSKLLPKNSKSPSTGSPKFAPEKSKLLSVKTNSIPVHPKSPPSSLELIDPAIIFTPERKKENSVTLVSVF